DPLRLIGWERPRNARCRTRCSDDGLRRGLRSGRLPELSGDLDRIDPSRFPPQRLVARAVELAVVQAAERNGEFVADLPAEGEPLGKPHMVRLRGPGPAKEARAWSGVLEVRPIPQG